MPHRFRGIGQLGDTAVHSPFFDHCAVDQLLVWSQIDICATVTDKLL